MKLRLQSNLGWSHCSDTVAAHCQSRLASSSPHQKGWIISVKKYAEEKYFCHVVQFETNIALYVKCSKMRLYISSRGHFKQLWGPLHLFCNNEFVSFWTNSVPHQASATLNRTETRIKRGTLATSQQLLQTWSMQLRATHAMFVSRAKTTTDECNNQ